MSTSHQLLRRVVARHLDGASAIEVERMAEAMLGPSAAEAPPRLSLADGRFLRVSHELEPGLASNVADVDWVATWDRETDLVWSHVLGNAKDGQSWADSCRIARDHKIFDATCNAPDIRQLLSIIDYERYEPAVDPEYFRGPYGWHWSRTPAKAPADYAWFVSLDDGGAYRYPQSFHSHVRAVCAGQSLGLR